MIKPLCLLLLIAGVTAHADVNPVEIVDQMEHDYGVHHGFRRNHAKGICATGEFTAQAEAKNLSRSAIFDGQPHKVIARFSAAGGVPNVPDTLKIPRGLAFQIDLGNGVTHNFSMINVPIFVARTPQGFFDNMKAGTPEKRAAYIEKYPESKPFFAFLGGHNPPSSYAQSAYYSLNAFKFVNAKNEEQFVRWQFVPEAGESWMKDDEAKKADPDFLEKEIGSRLKKGPVTWSMIATLAEKGDSTVDPTSAWNGPHKTVKMATLKLTEAEDQAGGPCNKINYDPTRVTDGVGLSDDPILKFRSPAYAVSYGRRLADPVDKPASPEKRKAKNPAVGP